MESPCNDKIEVISSDLLELLKINNERRWSTVLEKIRDEYVNCNSDSKKRVANEFIIIMHGGMGSFLDFVLHKDRTSLIDENNRIDELRHKLYDECKKLQ